MVIGKVVKAPMKPLGEGVLGAPSRGVGDEIYEACLTGPAISALANFNDHFASRPLTHGELRLFFSSIAAFNRYTVAGIAILAGRLSDQVLPYRPVNGHEIGACVLDAAIDEYGLREGATHTELAVHMGEFLRVSSVEVNSRKFACPASVELGDALFAFYREKDAAFSLGVHTASEVTSMLEFRCWHDVFLKFSEYRLSRTLPEFDYMRVHYTQEPDHAVNARVCVTRYLEVFPEQEPVVREGVSAYMALYAAMFRELDTMIFI